jgi:hypothetical protein
MVLLCFEIQTNKKLNQTAAVEFDDVSAKEFRSFLLSQRLVNGWALDSGNRACPSSVCTGSLYNANAIANLETGHLPTILCWLLVKETGRFDSGSPDSFR